MNTFENMWRKFRASKKYREEFASSILKRSFPLQVKAIRKKQGLSQAQLAAQANVTQGVISRAEDYDYGNVTFTTAARIAAGLDMAFIGRFVPFSELARYSLELSEDDFAAIPSFNEEDQIIGEIELATPTNLTLPEALMRAKGTSERRENQRTEPERDKAKVIEFNSALGARTIQASRRMPNVSEGLYDASRGYTFG